MCVRKKETVAMKEKQEVRGVNDTAEAKRKHVLLFFIGISLSKRGSGRKFLLPCFFLMIQTHVVLGYSYMRITICMKSFKVLNTFQDAF